MNSTNQSTMTIGQLISDPAKGGSGKVMEGWFLTEVDAMKHHHQLKGNWYSFIEKTVGETDITEEMLKFIPSLRSLLPQVKKTRRQYNPASYAVVGNSNTIDLSRLKGWEQVEHVVVVPKKGLAERALLRGEDVSVISYQLDSVERLPVGSPLRKYTNFDGAEVNFQFKAVPGSFRLLDYADFSERYPKLIPGVNQGVGGVYIEGDTLVLCGHGADLKDWIGVNEKIGGMVTVCGPTNNNAGDTGFRFRS